MNATNRTDGRVETSSTGDRISEEEERALLTIQLTSDLSDSQAREAWMRYQSVISRFLKRMGEENAMLESIKRVVFVRNLGGVLARIALIPKFGKSVLLILRQHSLSELVVRLAGECALMELSAAAGYRTFCFPDLVKGLLKTGKMQHRPVERMLDTFEFLNTMMQHGYDDERVLAQFERTNALHGKYRVAGALGKDAQDLFKYIALNMFYVGPMMRPDLTPQERHAICGLTVLVSRRMGHPAMAGSVLEFEEFIRDYERSFMFARDDKSELRTQAIAIAQASRKALYQIPTILPARIHGYVPHNVKQILELE